MQTSGHPILKLPTTVSPDPTQTLPRKPTKRLGAIPGPPAASPMGHGATMRRDLLPFLQRSYTAYGDLFRVRFPGRRPTLVALGTAANELVLNDTQHLFSSAAPTFGKHRPYKDTMATKDFADHDQLREQFDGAFSREALVGYLERMNESAASVLSGWPTQGIVKFYPQIKSLLLQVNADALAGLELSRSKRLRDTCARALSAEFAHPTMHPTGKARRRELRAAKTLTSLLRDLVPGRRVNRSSDMFSQLCQTELEDTEIARNLFALWHTAHDSTAIAMTNIVYSLARYPDWQERLRNDVASIKLSDAGPSFDDLSSLDTIEWVFKEVLRLYSPIQLLQRRSLTSVNFAGYQIPENASVLLFPHFTHHIAKWFAQPASFDPLRFAPQRAEDRRHPFVFVPFGQGAHRCIGSHFALLQVRALLVHLLPRYRFELPDNHQLQVRCLPRPIPKDDLRVNISAIAS